MKLSIYLHGSEIYLGMRTLEITLAIILSIIIIFPIVRRENLTKWGSIIALGTMVVHLVFEGFRWQMLPLYGITFWLSFTAVLQFSKHNHQQKKSRKRRIVTSMIGLFFLCCALILPILLPIPKTPNPTGSFNVGTTKLFLVDHSREELYAENPEDPRILSIQIWYPADANPNAKNAVWMDHMEIMGPALAAKLKLPSFFLDHVRYAQTHAYINIPISNEKSHYPIVLFSHGWGGFKSQNTFQVEELASHGYIVVAPDHTYGALATVLPDGEVAFNNPNALPVDSNQSKEAFQKSAQDLGHQWAGDLSFILDSLEDIEAHQPWGFLGDHIDLTHIGVMGHSTGGGAAIQFCSNDPRCKAVLGMDPYMDPVSVDTINLGINTPFMALFSESWAKNNEPNNDLFNIFAYNSLSNGYVYYIKGTAHYDFTDMPAFSPLAPYLGLKGKLDGDQVLIIIRTYTLAFFDRYLKEGAGSILDQRSAEFPEIINLE